MKNLIFLLLFTTAIIINQTPFLTHIKFEDYTKIKVPNLVFVHCIIGFPNSKHPYYLIKEGLLYKPFRKMYEYDFDIELGINIHLSKNNKIRDYSIYPDFSFQHLAIILYSISIALIFKLFL